MRECEALCTRLGILSDGRFACLGQTQRLKAGLGCGANVLVHSDMEPGPLTAAIVAQFPGSTLRRRHGGTLVRFFVPGQAWHDIFAGMEVLRERDDVQDYMVSDVSLTEVFLHFVRKQESTSLTSTPSRVSSEAH